MTPRFRTPPATARAQTPPPPPRDSAASPDAPIDGASPIDATSTDTTGTLDATSTDVTGTLDATGTDSASPIDATSTDGSAADAARMLTYVLRPRTSSPITFRAAATDVTETADEVNLQGTVYLVRSSTEMVPIQNADLTLSYGTDRTQGWFNLRGTADAFIVSPLTPTGAVIPTAPGAQVSVGSGAELTALGHEEVPVQPATNYLLLSISDSLNAGLTLGAGGPRVSTGAGVSTVIAINPAAPGFAIHAGATGLLLWAPITDVGLGLSGARDFSFTPDVTTGLPTDLAAPFRGHLFLTGTALSSSSTEPFAYTGTIVADLDTDMDGRLALEDLREPYRIGVNGDMEIASTWLASLLGIRVPLVDMTAVVTHDGDRYRMGFSGVTDPSLWMPAWAPIAGVSESASGVISSVLSENRLTYSSAMTVDLSRLPHPSAMAFRAVTVAAGTVTVSATGIQVTGSFGESPLGALGISPGDTPVNFDLRLMQDPRTWQMTLRGRLRVAGHALSSVTVSVNRDGATVTGVLDGTIATVTLTGMIASDADFRLTGTATVDLPTRTATQIVSTVTSAAQCGTMTVTSASLCGVDTVGSCILHPTRCRVARTCSVARTCNVASTCSVANTCSVAATCNVANTCSVPNTCTVSTWGAGSSDSGNYHATVSLTLNASGVSGSVSGALSCLPGFSTCGLVSGVRFDPSTLRACVRIIPAIGMSGSEICARI